jgi:hypothetical protein
MDELSTLDEAFSRLVYDKAARERLRRRDWTGLGESTRRALSGIDLDELDRLGSAVRRGLETGDLGGLGVRPGFPRTLASLAARGGEEAVLDGFVASAQLREVDGIGRRAGVSVAEAFHDWARGELQEDPAALCVLQHELAGIVLKTLVHSAVPGFQIRTPLIRATERGHLCVLDAVRPLRDAEDKPEQPFVHTSAGGRYVSGRLSLPVAALLLGASRSPPSWSEATLAGTTPGWRELAWRQLSERGLL